MSPGENMMSNNKGDHENDDIFAWLKPRLRLPEETGIDVPPLKPEILDPAWDAAQAHRRYQLKYGSYHERLLPLAASDGTLRDRSVRINNIGGEWSVTREEIPGDPESQILKFKCREELIPHLQGREVTVQIGMETFVLGLVNRNGVAEIEIPKGVDMTQAIDVCIQERIDL